MDSGQSPSHCTHRRIGLRLLTVLIVLLVGAWQQASAQYRLLGVPGEIIPVHTHFPGLCPGSSQALCPEQGNLRPGTDVKPLDTRDGWTLVQYNLDARPRQAWVEGTRVRYLAGNIQIQKSWSPALMRLAQGFRRDVTKNGGWAPEGRRPSLANDTEMARVAGWPIEVGPLRIMPARIKGQMVSIVAVSEGGSCSAMDTQVWSRNLSKMLGPKETSKDERNYPFYSGRLRAWSPQVWSGPVLIDRNPYRIDANFSNGYAYILSDFGVGFQPIQTLFDIPVLKRNPTLSYCSSKKICNAIISGKVRLISARHSYRQLTKHQKIFHWNKQIVSDLGQVELTQGGPELHLGIAQEMFKDTEGCGHIEVRQWPLIERHAQDLDLESAQSKRLRLKFTHFGSNSLTWLNGNGSWNTRAEFVRIHGKLLIERLDGAPPQLPGSATYWRVEQNGKLKRVAEFTPIYRRLTIPLKISNT